MTAASAAPTLGIDLGGTNLRIGVVDAAGAILAEVRDPAPSEVDALVHAIGAQADDLVPAHGVRAVGVGTAGLIDHDGAVRYAPNLPMFVDVPLRALLAERLTPPVVVDNDANAAAWGEHCHGAARGTSHALVITLGTGVGGGVIADGRLFRGAHGFAAEVGHWQFDPHGPDCACGEVGHWEAVASGSALGRLARARAEQGTAPGVLARAGGDAAAVRGEHAGESAAAGEADGIAILGEFAEVVALGFAGLANIVDPELIVVSGGLVELGDVLLDPLRAAFLGHLEGSAHRPPVPIVAAELGDASGMVGAAALARDLTP
ncbi:MAG: ROK family protein [Acidimicrobiia bacterium]|nr:ROK family protein [Acidimicrobiia bacterium]